MSSAGTQGLLSPQGMGMLSPLSIQKPYSCWGLPVPLTQTCSAPSVGLFPPGWPSSWLTDMLSSNSLGAFALVVPLLELLVSSYLGLVLSPMRPTGNPSCNLGPLHLPVLPGVGALGLPGYLETRRSGSRARRARGRAEEQGVAEVGSGSGRESRPHQAPGPCTHPQPLPAVLRALAKDPPSGLKVVLKKGHPRPYFALGWSRELAHSPPPIKGTVLNAFLFHMTTCGTQLAPFFS